MTHGRDGVERSGAPTPAPTAKRPLRTRIAFAVAVWALGAVAIEVVLRVCGFAPLPRATLAERYDKFRPDDDLTWSLAPGWTGFELNDVPVRTNTFGCRGPEPRAPRPPDVPRLLFLGDSVTYGHLLPEDATIPNRLASALATMHGTPAEVVNAGVPGYSTFQEAASFRRLQPQLAPDIVLLGFCLNDVTERYESMAAWGGSRFFMMNVDTTAGMGPVARLWHATAIRNATWAFLRAAGTRGEGVRLSQLWSEPDAAHVRRAWDTVFGEIDSLADDVRAARARFAVVIFPCESQCSDAASPRAPQDALLAHLQERGIPALDLLPPLLARRTESKSLFLDATHFTPHGAQVVAAEIARFVDANGLAVPRTR